MMFLFSYRAYIIVTTIFCVFSGFIMVNRDFDLYLTMLFIILGMIASFLSINHDFETGMIHIPLLKGYSRTKFLQAKIIWCIILHYIYALLIVSVVIIINCIKQKMGEECLYKNGEIVIYLLYVGLPAAFVSILGFLNFLLTKNILLSIIVTFGYVFLTLMLQQLFIANNTLFKYLFISYHFDYFALIDGLSVSSKSLILIAGQVLCISKITILYLIMNRKLKSYDIVS